jgi:WhiB family transcriptional regulator, redox-sensing transcriptional regulator
MPGYQPHLTYRTGMRWTERAECRESDPELFFPLTTSGPSVYQTDQARAVCVRCAVRAQCLAWSLTNNITHGVWGGLSEQERRVLPASTDVESNAARAPSATTR